MVRARPGERREELRRFCVIVLSVEACREKGHVLAADHIVQRDHNRRAETVGPVEGLGWGGGMGEARTRNKWMMERARREVEKKKVGEEGASEVQKTRSGRDEKRGI